MLLKGISQLFGGRTESCIEGNRSKGNGYSQDGYDKNCCRVRKLHFFMSIFPL